jgi:hypothetical protein
LDRVDVLFEGTRDLLGAFMSYFFTAPEIVIENAKNKTLKRYLPIFEQVKLTN